MKMEELSASQAHFTYDIDRISRLRQNAGKVGIIGQPRAMSALRMGMNVNTKGYNIYISGEDGTGRHTAVREIASSLKTERPVLDMVYAYNFRRPQSPFLISLPSPSGSVLSEGMETIASLVSDALWEKASQIVSELKENLPSSVLLDQFLMQVKEALGGEVPEADKYRVNLVCDNSGLQRCPLVEEYHPTHTNLFGQMTSSSEYAHLRLTSGSLLDAAGGFFVVRADKILSQEGLWESLKLYAESSSFIVRGQNDKNSTFIRPVTSAVATKIILIGSDELYDKLCDSDDEFLRLFKVSAEF
ncbi:MAG: AAA family ATPase, partial [Spirochaetales bacterium]|nr:AAA family ATPase [Spirochaetales bacterium]